MRTMRELGQILREAFPGQDVTRLTNELYKYCSERNFTPTDEEIREWIEGVKSVVVEAEKP